MTFYEAYKTVLTRFNEKERNLKIQRLIESGLNAGIHIIASNYPVTKSLNFTPVKNTPVTLPQDFITLELLMQGSTILSENDYMIKGDFIIISDPDLIGEELTMIYNYAPAQLSIDTDSDTEIPVSLVYHNPIISYASYYYSAGMDKPDTTAQYYNEFMNATGIGRGDKNASRNKKS